MSLQIDGGSCVKSRFLRPVKMRTTNTDICPIDKTLFQAGKRTIPLVAMFEESTEGETKRIVLKNVASIRADVRRKRMVGFLSEGAKITFSPYLVVVHVIVDLIDPHTLWKDLLCVGAGTIAVPFFTLFLPLTFAIAVIFESGRTIRYAATHTTIVVGSQKYFVNTKKYKAWISQSFDVEAAALSTNKRFADYKKGSKILELCGEKINSVIESKFLLTDYKNALNKPLHEAFLAEDYELMKTLIQFGANPYLMVEKMRENGYEFGSVFAMVNNLMYEWEDEDLTALFNMLVERLPEDSKSTSFLQFDLGNMTIQGAKEARLEPFTFFGRQKLSSEELLKKIYDAKAAGEENRVYTRFEESDLTELKEGRLDERLVCVNGLWLMERCEIGTLGAFLNQRLENRPELHQLRQEDAGEIRVVEPTVIYRPLYEVQQH